MSDRRTPAGGTWTGTAKQVAVVRRVRRLGRARFGRWVLDEEAGDSEIVAALVARGVLERHPDGAVRPVHDLN